jgi:hypothetical protein
VLRLLQEAQYRAHGHVRHSPAWLALAALEAEAHAGLGDVTGCPTAVSRAERASEHIEPGNDSFGTDFSMIPV